MLVRKIAAALLLLLLLFNWIGYSFVADYLQYHSDIHLEKQLDANLYNEDEKSKTILFHKQLYKTLNII